MMLSLAFRSMLPQQLQPQLQPPPRQQRLPLPRLQNQSQKVAPFLQEIILVVITTIGIRMMLSLSAEEGLSLPSLPSTLKRLTTN